MQAGDGRKGGIKGDRARSERLAAQLRANLKRRKDRARKLAAERDAAKGNGPDRDVRLAQKSVRD